MSLLFDVIFAHRCTSTHHKMAMDALTLFDGEEADWAELFLKYADDYLKGAKAPDNVFRDSVNQVLHVHQNYWGGAPKAAEEWSKTLIEQLAAKRWREAVYAAGVLSHYFADPIQPLHTGQSEAEGAVHAPLERSISKSYVMLKQRLMDQHGGYPKIISPDGEDWAAQMVRQGAETAAPYYDLCIDHYDVAAGAKDPLKGMDDALQDVICQLIGLATAGIAAMFRRAIEEAGVTAPKVSNDVRGYLAVLDIPIRSLTKRMADPAERKLVEAIAAEFAARGKVTATLSPDDHAIREAYAREVLGIEPEDMREERARKPGALHGMPASRIIVEPTPLPFEKLGIQPPPRPPGEAAESKSTKAEKPAKAASAKPQPPNRDVQVVDNPLDNLTSGVTGPSASAASSRAESGRTEGRAEGRAEYDDDVLDHETDVVDAPAIGPKTADRLAAIGVRTIGDLMELEAEEAAGMLNAPHIRANTIRDWQAMTALAMAVPALRGIDAQGLVTIGIRDPEALQAADPTALRDKLLAWIRTGDGQRVFRAAKAPTLEAVSEWVGSSARQAA